MNRAERRSGRRRSLSLFTFERRSIEEVRSSPVWTVEAEAVPFPDLETALGEFADFIQSYEHTEEHDHFYLFEVGTVKGDVPAFSEPQLVARVVACSDPDCLTTHVDSAGQVLH